MTESKSACSRAATLEQAAKESTCENVSLDPDYNAYDGPISSLLSYGAENARTLRELENLTGLSGRIIRRQIEVERRQGIPILSDSRDGCSGYYLPTCDYEIRRFVGSMRGRAREILATAQAVENGGRAGGD